MHACAPVHTSRVCIVQVAAVSICSRSQKSTHKAHNIEYLIHAGISLHHLLAPTVDQHGHQIDQMYRLLQIRLNIITTDTEPTWSESHCLYPHSDL